LHIAHKVVIITIPCIGIAYDAVKSCNLRRRCRCSAAATGVVAFYFHCHYAHAMPL